MTDKNNKHLSMTRQCKLLNINRTSIYYKPKPENNLNMKLKKLIKEKFEKHPFYGVPRMHRWLRTDKGFSVNKKRIERLYKELNLKALEPKKNLSKSVKEHKKYPYLLKDIKINRVGKVWQTDISYIPTIHKRCVY